MKHVIKKPSDTQVHMTVTLTAADLAPIQQKTIARLAKNVKAAGFRPGKVPVQVAAKQIDPNHLSQEVLEDAVNTTAVDVFDAEKIVPLDRPKVDVVSYVPGESLEYTAEVEVIPAITLGDYTKLKATKDAVKIGDTEIDEVIERLQVSMATKEDVDRAAQDGDEVVMDFEGTDKDGKEVPGASGTDYPLTLGSGTFIPGFEEGLVGKKTGDVFDLPLTFPKDYHHKPLAGAKVTFKVTVKSVKGVQKPDLNDEFAAKAGPFKTLAELKADVTRELTEQKEREAVDKMKDMLVEQLVKGSHVPAPDVLVDDQIASIERDFIQNLMYRGITLDQYLEQEKLTKEEWHTKELRPQAERRVQVGLALAELSKAEGIEVSREELDVRLQEMLQRYGNAPDVAKQLDTPETRRDIANRMLTEKTVDRLVDINSKK
ncbi:MAG TPA: trigger factor [Candidatus Saccharimonadales bacterium]|nr:trigger factor [Candidatus Saccharimonadales bacterium]